MSWFRPSKRRPREAKTQALPARENHFRQRPAVTEETLRADLKLLREAGGLPSHTDDVFGTAILNNISSGNFDLSDSEMIDEIRARAHRLEMTELSNPTPFREPSLRQGTLNLGLSWGGNPINCGHDILNTSLLAIGLPGAGKTTLVNHIIVQMLQHPTVSRQVRFWMHNVYKLEHRHLLNFDPDLVVIADGCGCWNPLQSELSDPRRWPHICADSLTRTGNFPERSSFLIRNAINDLYEEFGIYRGSENYPVLHDLHRYFQSGKGRAQNQSARHAILDRLVSWLIELGPQLAYRKAWRVSDLVHFSLVFELHRYSESSKFLVMNHSLGSLPYALSGQRELNSGLGLVVVTEDSQRLFRERSSASGDLTPLDEISTILRGFGGGLCTTGQTTNGFSKTIMATAAVKAMGQLGLAEDYQRLGSAMGMIPPQIQWAKTHLRPGALILHIRGGAPFILRAPDIRLPQTVTNEDAANSLRRLDHLPTVRATEYDNWTPYPVTEVRDAGRTWKPELGSDEPVQGNALPVPVPVAETEPGKSTPSETARSHQPQLSDDERKFLWAVIEHPAEPSSSYARLATMGTKKAARIRKKLVEEEFLREHRLSTGARGRAAVVLEPLEKALSLMGRGS